MMNLFPPVILASKSPRRQEILSQMGISFRTVLKEVDESFPADLEAQSVAEFIALKKMAAFSDMNGHELIITADTVVVAGSEILGKPQDDDDAARMLRLLSGKVHSVTTGVAIRYGDRAMSFSDTTLVSFRALLEEEINYYVQTYRPLDKAGAYGIQEWIGLNAIARIEGSYTNVVGLPSEKLYSEIRKLL